MCKHEKAQFFLSHIGGHSGAASLQPRLEPSQGKVDAFRSKDLNTAVRVLTISSHTKLRTV